MTEKTLPPSKSGDSTRAARGLKDGPPIDPNSATLVNYPPVTPSTLAHGPGETIQASPPPPEQPPVVRGSPDPAPAGLSDGGPTTHTARPGNVEPTIAPRSAVVDPNAAPVVPGSPDPAPPDLAPPLPTFAATQEFVRPNPSDLTVSGAPDQTLGGHDMATQAFHRDAFALPPASPGATLAGHDAATQAFHQAAFSAPTHDATLGGHDAATQAFHQQAMAGAPKAISTGASFGHYELIEPIAKGGMGIVYKARQRNLNRIVAIKMILAGQFADQSDIDRFYAEAEAAAALSHPNIVAIHEIGQVQGQHFFSMDYIEGKSLAGLIQENPVPPRRAAEFVRTIAETMQFAHDSGVVHRDLKPANILLDKRQRPLITDFGLAKQVSNTSQLTMAGSIVGTPSYMPPEQAAGRIDEVGPWSDTYSLGAILYELLTGRPPFRAASPFETIRQVLEQEPPSPRLLNPALPRDLETIALKCLQKERARRYESSQELADELGRYLRGEPIHARPISQVHRFWRLCKRNPITSSAIASAVVALVAATVISFSFYLKASYERAQADASFKDANEAVDKFLTRVGEKDLANLPGGQKIQKELLDEALVYNDRFLKQRADDPRVANEVARSHFRVAKISMTLGRYDDALNPLTAARQMQESLLAEQPSDAKRLKALSDTLTELGQIYVRKVDLDAATAAYDEAAQIRGRLATAVPDNTEYQRLHASSHMNAGLAAFNMAKLNKQDKKFNDRLRDARDRYEHAQKIRQILLKQEPENLLVQRDLGKGFFNLGTLANLEENTPEAIKHFRNASHAFESVLKIEPKDLENQGLLTTCYRFVGALSKDDPEEARNQFKDALSRLDKLVKENPDVPEFQTQQAGLLQTQAEFEREQGNTADALTALQRARKIYTPLVEKFPEVPTYQRDLALTLRELAIDEFAAGNEKLAKENLDEAIARLDELVKQFPREAEYEDRRRETKEVVLAKPPE